MTPQWAVNVSLRRVAVCISSCGTTKEARSTMAHATIGRSGRIEMRHSSASDARSASSRVGAPWRPTLDRPESNRRSRLR